MAAMVLARCLGAGTAEATGMRTLRDVQPKLEAEYGEDDLLAAVEKLLHPQPYTLSEARNCQFVITMRGDLGNHRRRVCTIRHHCLVPLMHVRLAGRRCRLMSALPGLVFNR